MLHQSAFGTRLTQVFGLLTGMFIATNSAQALIDLRLSGGSYDGKYKVVEDGSGTPVTDANAETFTNKGTQISAGVGLSPIPLAPFSVGLFYSMTSAKGVYAQDTMDSKIDSGRGGLDVMIWAPMPKIKPYLRAGYYLFGKENLTISTRAEAAVQGSVKYPMDISGYQMGLGIGMSLAPFISVFLDYSLDRYSLTTKTAVVTSGEVSSTVTSDNKIKISNEAATISLGLAVSI